MSNSLWPHGLQHARLPSPSPSPGVCSNSCPLSRWCHPSISSTVASFFSCPHSFIASGSFPMRLHISWVQFSSVAQSCPTLCDPMNRSTPDLPVHHQLPDFAQTQSSHQVAKILELKHQSFQRIFRVDFL